MGSFRKSLITFLAFSLVIFSCTAVFGAVPAIVGQDEGGIAHSPVKFNMGEDSEMSQGHRVHVNAATGNLVVKHTDLVIPTKGKDIVISRTYNSLRHLHGIESGLELSATVGPIDCTVTVADGVCWINGERLEFVSTSIPLNSSQDTFTRTIFIVNENGVAYLSADTSYGDSPNALAVGSVHYTDDDGAPPEVSASSSDNTLGKDAKEYIDNPQIGNGGKWRFNFESYAFRDRYQVTSTSYVNHLTFLNGEGTSSFIKTDSLSAFDPVVGQTEKREYLSCEFIAPDEDGNPFFVTWTQTSDGLTVYTRHNRFECVNLDGEKHIYKGIQVYSSSYGSTNIYRDDAVLSEIVDANGNRLVYEWKDGSANGGSWPSPFSEGSFSAYFSSNRNIYLNRIYDDNENDGPDSVQVLFNYNEADGISDIVVTDAEGNNPQVVAEYDYEISVIPPEHSWEEETYELGNLTGYTDFHGRHFDYIYSDSDSGTTFLTGSTDPVGGVLSISYWDPSFKVFRVESPKYSDANVGDFVTPPEIIYLSGSLCEQYTYDWEMRETYRALPEENSVAVFKWEADIKDNSNILEDRRIIKREIHSLSNWLSNNPVTTTIWDYNADTVMVLSETDGNGYTTSFEYNGKRQLTRKAYPDGSDEIFTYSTDGYDNLVSHQDPNGNLTTYNYDNPERHLVTSAHYTSDGVGYSKYFSYYSDGLLQAETDSGGFTVSYAYDDQGQINSKDYARMVYGAVDPQQVSEEFFYNVFGQLEWTSDAGGHETDFFYDSNRYLYQKRELVSVDGVQTLRSETYGRDLLGNITSVTDYEGGITLFGYNADGMLTATWKKDTLGQDQLVSEYDYDTTGKLVWKRDALGHETWIYRNPAGWVSDVVEKSVTVGGLPVDLQTNFTYDLAGNMETKTPPNGNTWTYSYNSMNRLSAVLEPGSATATSYAYDANGNLTWFRDANNNSATFTYNALDKVKSVSRPDRTTRHFSYDGESRLKTSMESTSPGADDISETVYLDGGTSETSMDVIVGKVNKIQYDLAVKVTPGPNAALTFKKIGVFLSRGDICSESHWTVSCQTDVGGKPSGVFLQRSDGSDAIVSKGLYWHDVHGWVDFDIGGFESGFDFDVTTDQPFWVVLQATGSGSQRNHYWYVGYEGSNPGQSAARVDGGNWTVGDYGIGIELVNLTRVEDKDYVTTYWYNPEGTLESVSLADGQNLTYGYDIMGHQVYASRADSSGSNVETESGYDINGRLTSRTQWINGMAELSMHYRYNALGQVTHIDYPVSYAGPFSVDMAYTGDAFHYLESIPGYISDLDYDPNGRVTGMTFANGFSEDTSYDELGRPDAFGISDPAAQVARFLETYAWDPNGNLDTKSWDEYDASGNRTDYDFQDMSYDLNDRLTGVNADFGDDLSYDYDGAGNRLYKPADPTWQYVYDSSNRMLAEVYPDGAFTEFSWAGPDGRQGGNLISKKVRDSTYQYVSTLAHYTWTEDGLLINVDRPGVASVSYRYDAAGNRVRKDAGNDVTMYLFQGLDVKYEENPDGSQAYYVHALGRHVTRVDVDTQGNLEKHFYHADYLGSVRMVTDEEGDIVWTERYRPFGGEENQTGDLPNDYRFTGKGYDQEADLYYFNARWYDPDVGRFISEDPLWGNIRDPQSLNRFAYGRNNPYRYVDPTGNFTFLIYNHEMFCTECGDFGMGGICENLAYSDVEQFGLDVINNLISINEFKRLKILPTPRNVVKWISEHAVEWDNLSDEKKRKIKEDLAKMGIDVNFHFENESDSDENNNDSTSPISSDSESSYSAYGDGDVEVGQIRPDGKVQPPTESEW